MKLPLLGNAQLKAKLEEDVPLSHAYLLAGAFGSGRSAVITYIGQKALCTAEGNRPCTVCPACKKVENNIHPDFLIMGNKDGKPLTVEEIRGIQEDSIIRPNEGARKVYVILQGDELGQSGQNALLKVLEEPPSYALFVLVTGESGGMLETIRSRCQILRLSPVSLKEAEGWLAHRYPDRKDLEAEKLQGYLGRANVFWGESIHSSLRKQEQRMQQMENFQKLQGKRPLKGKLKASPDEEHQELFVDSMAGLLVESLLRGEELAVLEQSVSLEKLEKALVVLFFDRVRYHLVQGMKQGNTEQVSTALEVVEDLSYAVPFHVGISQLLAWLMGVFFQSERK